MDKIKQLIKYFNIDENRGETYVFERLKLELMDKLDEEKLRTLEKQVHEYFLNSKKDTDKIHVTDKVDPKHEASPVENQDNEHIEVESPEVENKEVESTVVESTVVENIEVENIEVENIKTKDIEAEKIKRTQSSPTISKTLQPMRIALFVVSIVGLISMLAMPSILVKVDNTIVNIVLAILIGVAYFVFDFLESQTDKNRKNKISHLVSVIMAILSISIGILMIVITIIGGEMLLYGLVLTFILVRVCVIFSLGVIAIFALSAFTPFDFVCVRATR